MRRCVILLSASVFIACGCAGPNRLSRGLDLRVNQLNVDNPLLATVLNPFCFVGMNGAWLVDAAFVNPWYFWNDVRVGRGTAYFYTDPVTPENLDPDVLDSVPDAPEAPDTPSPPKNLTRENSPPPVAPGEPIPYTVQPGDTLASIARKYYGKPHRWKEIYMANQNVLASPDAIKPGQVLAIPPRH